MMQDLFNETKKHFVTWQNSYGNTYTDEHNLKKFGSLWVSDKKSDMYVPCVSCYFYLERGKDAPTRVGSKTELYAVFKKLKRYGKGYNHICKKCLQNEPIEFLEVSFDWYEARHNQKEEKS